ncbi:MAG: diacylglycerol kinase family lipid kinase [Rhodospirillum sp.]|nr:diacylglycerol kinase family lipid kinase [Rhodospirillum sp.]MCF8488981.1 diacylglycerol kinase family lipid kinase [Rhodospirillum sp.]MCF8500022.1 diacylglycerol kinase family lipid kinase [Rhodospirillum sp.]
MPRLLPFASSSSSRSALAALPRRVMVIANPAAGTLKGRRLNKALLALEREGCWVSLRETTKPGDATLIAREARRESLDVVVAAGGDGTINEVANGLAGSGVALGIIPLGTANVLAIEAGIPRDPTKAARIIARGQPRELYMGEVTASAETPLGGPRRFVMMAGAGFDAHVVDTVDLDLKRRSGKFAYVWRTLQSALTYRFPPVSVEVERPNGEILHRDVATAVVCNGKYYGGPFIAAPAANISYPTFQVVLLPRPGLGNVARYALALAMGRLPHLPDVEVMEATRIRVRMDGAEPLQADGDTVAHMPVSISMAPDPVHLIVPA